MQGDKPKLSPLYVYIVDAIVVHETQHARKFRFGSNEFWVPKSVSKLIELDLYILQRVVHEKMSEWHGQFVQGSHYTKLELTKASNTQRAIELLEQALALLRRT